ncbi:hypothetical protein GGF32_005063 [Allomyces javanicus]|nr:hypothetical protein GGF32_005063 [Allomyces javanicus]
MAAHTLIAQIPPRLRSLTLVDVFDFDDPDGDSDDDSDTYSDDDEEERPQPMDLSNKKTVLCYLFHQVPSTLVFHC